MEESLIIDVIGQHAEEAAFLWLLREDATRQPHYSLADLIKLDGRVAAHLDGLRIAGKDGWEVCRENLDRGDRGEVFAAAVVAFESQDDERIHETLEAATAKPGSWCGVVSALNWLSFHQADRHIQYLCDAKSPQLRQVGIAAAAAHRRHPGVVLIESLSDRSPALTARAIRVVGELGILDLLPLVQRSFRSDDALCRFSAAWTTALLTGDSDAVRALGSIAKSNALGREEAMQVAVRRMELRFAHVWLEELASRLSHVRLAVIGAGAVGDSASVPWLLDQMKVPALARVAGESFSMITGIDLALQNLEGPKPAGFDAGPLENPEDEGVAMDPDENLSWPKPAAVQAWWSRHRGDFPAGTRYLLGRPITPEWSMDVLRTGRQRQRAAAALELAIRQPGQPLFDVRAPGFRQQLLLGMK